MRALAEPASVAGQLKRTGCSAVHVHLDLDVLDPAAFPYTTYSEPGGATIGQVPGLLETIDRALPVTSAFVGEHLGGDEPGTAAVAPGWNSFSPASRSRDRQTARRRAASSMGGR